jgi:hypothetical protein
MTDLLERLKAALADRYAIETARPCSSQSVS